MTILRQIEKDKTGKEKKKDGNPGIRLKLTDFTNKKYNLSQANSFTLDWRINFGRIITIPAEPYKFLVWSLKRSNPARNPNQLSFAGIGTDERWKGAVIA